MIKRVMSETERWLVIWDDTISDSSITILRRGRDIQITMHNLSQASFIERFAKLAKGNPHLSEDKLLHTMFLMYSREALS